MKSRNILFAFLVLIVTAQFGTAQSQQQKDRDSFLNNARLLEQQPFNKNARDAREWGFKWLIDTDQVSVVLCSETMSLIPEKKNKFKSELTMQFTFGQAVFKLENADKKDDEAAAQLAGIESMLRTYEKIVIENDKARNTELDGLVAKQKSGELKAIVDSKKCDSKTSK